MSEEKKNEFTPEPEEIGGEFLSPEELQKEIEKTLGKRMVIRPLPGRPQLEAIRDELYDTKELLPNGTVELDFFRNPAAGQVFSNMIANGMLPYPQQFHLFGLTLHIYSVREHVGPETPKTFPYFDRLRNLLVGNATIKYIIGAKPYLDAPVNSIIKGLVPSDVKRPSDAYFTIPELTERDIEDLLLDIHCYDECRTIKPEIRESKEPIVGPIINPYPFQHFYNMTVYLKRGMKPLYIPSRQAFRAEFTWDKKVTFDPDILGQVYVRVGMAGVRWREVC